MDRSSLNGALLRLERASSRAKAKLCILSLCLLLPFSYGHAASNEDLQEAIRLDAAVVLLYRQGRFGDAIQEAEQSLAIRERVLDPEHRDTGRSVNNLAALYQATAQHSRALPLFQRAVAISKKANGLKNGDTAGSLSNLAVEYRLIGQYAKALPVLEEALSISEEVNGPNHERTGTIVNNLAVLYEAMGQYAKAVLLHKRALEITVSRKGMLHSDTSTSLSNLAAAYASMEDYGNSLPLYEQALEISEEVSGTNHPVTGLCLNNLAALYRSMGLPKKSIPLYERALSIAEGVESTAGQGTAIALGNLGGAYQAMRQYDTALPLLERAISISEKTSGAEHPITAVHLNNLAVLYQEMSQFGKALPLLERALEITERSVGPEHPDMGRRLNNIAGVHKAMGNDQKALLLFHRALVVSAMVDSSEMRWVVAANIAEIYSTRNSEGDRRSKPELSAWYGKLAVNTLQSTRGRLTSLSTQNQQAFLTSKERYYSRLSGLLISSGRVSEALEVLSMLKEQDYYDFQSRGSEDDSPRTRASWNEREAPLASEFDDLMTRLGAVAAEFNPLEQRARNPKLAEFLSPAERTRLDALRTERASLIAGYQALAQRLTSALAPRDAAPGAFNAAVVTEQSQRLQRVVTHLQRNSSRPIVLLHYVVNPDRIWIVVQRAPQGMSAPSDQLAAVPVAVKSADLLKDIVAFRLALQSPRGEPLASAKTLHKVLIAPIRNRLPENAVLMLALTGALRYVPFAALHDGEHYLVERHATAQLNDAALQNLERDVAEIWKLVGFGMTQATGGFKALPAVREELEGSLQALKGQGTTWFDAEFTEVRLNAALALPQPVLHLASHFKLEPGVSQNSFLLLGDGQHWSLDKARQQSFKGIDLLVLSACETAKPGGWDAEGKEVESFGMLAQLQGANAVLASLWKVADPSTAQLMQGFYRVRQSTAQISKAEALRKVQLAMLGRPVQRGTPTLPSRGASRADSGPQRSGAKSGSEVPFAHPYYWAPFVLMGNWL
ncbi:tetratricopeptide repeat protein [Roseateles sp. NT4]|uniref:CHAT domain-containing protein n=1 Tax=Roseateles sp. NT4 TaxID=3453715 RepID=UPI003EEB505E